MTHLSGSARVTACEPGRYVRKWLPVGNQRAEPQRSFLGGVVVQRSERVAALMMLVFPHGGQRGARRNARAALARTQAQTAARREAIAALRGLTQSVPAPSDAREVQQA